MLHSVLDGLLNPVSHAYQRSLITEVADDLNGDAAGDWWFIKGAGGVTIQLAQASPLISVLSVVFSAL